MMLQVPGIQVNTHARMSVRTLFSFWLFPVHGSSPMIQKGESFAVIQDGFPIPLDLAHADILVEASNSNTRRCAFMKKHFWMFLERVEVQRD